MDTDAETTDVHSRRTRIDRITNLPDDIIDNILSRLSTKQVARTSALSTKWRHRWANLPWLVFDKHTVHVSFGDEELRVDKLARIVDRVLLLHCGPIHKFELSCGATPVYDMDKWVLHLSRSAIRELVLDIDPIHLYIMPSCLFSFQSLTHLELSMCLLRPPSAFNGFANLKSLNLKYVCYSQYSVDKLVSSCPLLERLTLRWLPRGSQLTIDSPNLKFFELECEFTDITDITFKNTSSLLVVVIHIRSPIAFKNLHKRFSSLPNLRRLEGRFIEHLFDEPLPRDRPKPCDNLIQLKSLYFFLDFNCLENILRAHYLLKSTPNLEELRIKSITESESDGETETDITDYGNFQLNKLRRIEMDDIYGSSNEMDFVAYMLSASPTLESMTVKPRRGYSCNQEMVKKLLRMRRASVHAEIIL